MFELWHFMLDNSGEILSQAGEHLGLTLIALLLAIVTGMPLGIITTRYKKLSGGLLGAVGVIQTIPSIALLGFLLPIFGIGTVPAIIALFLYALLPIVRNVHSGILDVDKSITEAARGMGMNNRQILTRVELPLAMPVIFAGIRTATVINVGVATLCALIGAGGLGEYIFRGIALNDVNMILAGAFPAALMALGFDFVLGLIEKYIHRWGMMLVSALLAIALIATGWLGTRHLLKDDFTAGMPTEFIDRPDGYKALKEHYNLTLSALEMNQALMYQALRNRKVDVIGGYSTDGRIEAFNLKILDDDKNFFPPYSCAPVLRQETTTKHPELVTALDKLAGAITNQDMIRMNFQVDQKKLSPERVARNFLNQNGFETGIRRSSEPDIVIGGKNFTEQFILAHIFESVIENNTTLSVDTNLGLAGTKIVFDALQNREIDLYPEYSGTGLYVWLKADEAVADSLGNSTKAIYRYVKEQSQNRFDITWLKPLGFENSYTLMMRKNDAEKLNINSISDLSGYLSNSSR